MHQMASTRKGHRARLIRRPQRARTEGPSPGPHGQPHPADPPTPAGTPQAGGAAARTGHLVAADPGLQPSGSPLPVAAGDQQGATLLTRAGHHRPRPGRRHRTPAQAEHHQIHAVHQHRGHLDRIGPGVGDDREPAQIRTHLHGRQQANVGLADDRRMPTRRRHRRHHAQRQRPGTRQHRHRPAWQRAPGAVRSAIREPAAKIPSPAAGRSTVLAPRRPPPTFPDTAAILRRRCSTCSARLSRAGQAHRCRHSSTSCIIRFSIYSNVCSIQ